MKILDRYIIKNYLSSFLFVVLIFSMIAVIIDFSQNVEEFIDEKLPAWRVAKEYYLNFVIFINGLLWPLFAMISVIFFTSRLAYNSEIIAILNAGVSFRRFMRPYLIGGGLIAMVHLISNHYIIPLSNKTRLDFFHSYIMKESDKGKTRDIHMFITPDTKIYVRDYFKRDSFARSFRLEKFDGNKLLGFIEAEEARWKGDKQKWQLSNYEIHSFNGREESIVVGGKEKLDTALALTPNDFVRYDDTREQIPTNKLQAFIAEEKLRGIGNTKLYEIELYRRTADPFTILIVTIIGMSVASRKVRGGMGLHLALGVALGALFIFLSKFSITFATNEALSPFLGVWIPNLVFLTVALLLIFKAQK
ncbi:MAG: LptF/LptG family permease [Lewinellaceae bacterium]|nr:LptF/LptG family permease [Saprospiraceae bacterium]MCB9338327.1 LptF/LptG family permease [Lewinellaceae bacterium]